jgi:two-component system sensor histidine kinase UhpB
MLQSLSLRVRLSALLGAVLALGFSIGVGLLILHASARVRAEADSSTRLARELVATALVRLDQSTDEPSIALGRMLGDVAKLRHVRIFIEGLAAPEQAGAEERRAPEWFSSLVMPRASVTRIKLDGHRHLDGELVIASNPADEIAEIWEEIVSLALGGAGLGLIAFAFVSLAAARTLQPVSAFAEGLLRLERGDYDVRFAPKGPPEIVMIAERINALAATLKRLDAENHRLVQRMIHVQDEERRDIARDLHDEIGPVLFTIRIGVGALARKLKVASSGAAALDAECRRIDEQLAQLQHVNRRILGRLRPAALEEMGLAGALEALVQGWREANPAVAIELNLHMDTNAISEDIALTAYRIVQEGLTNVFRHSGADLVKVDIRLELRETEPELCIQIRDNGSGLETNSREGIGLRGMSERVAAQGGQLALSSAEPKGALLEARLPLDGPKAGLTS